jgi:hypothetical protein
MIGYCAWTSRSGDSFYVVLEHTRRLYILAINRVHGSEGYQQKMAPKNRSS